MFFAMFCKIVSAPFLWLFFKLKVYGNRRESKPEGRTIIIANHISSWDAVLINFLFFTTKVHYLTIRELYWHNRLFTRFFRKMGSIRVNNSLSDLGALTQAIELLNQDKTVALFPEGTRSKDGAILPFRPGVVMIALNTKAPVIPVYIHGKYGLFRRIKVAVGEKIYLHGLCDEPHPPPEKVKELTEYLRDSLKTLAGEIT